MASFNQVTLLGSLGRDPEIKVFENGTKQARITLATQERGYQKKDGTQVQSKADWHQVVFWRQLADICEKYLKKGSLVLVQGKLRNRQYEKDGIKHYSTEVEADSLQMMPRNTPNATQGVNTDASQQPQISSSAQNLVDKFQEAGFEVTQQAADDALPF